LQRKSHDREQQEQEAVLAAIPHVFTSLSTKYQDKTKVLGHLPSAHWSDPLPVACRASTTPSAAI